MLGVLAIGSLGIGIYAVVVQSLPAPTIITAPANPTNQTTATFTYTDNNSVTRFECKLDTSTFMPCGTTRPSSQSYPNAALPNPLAEGSHTFQVRAVSSSQ